MRESQGLPEAVAASSSGSGPSRRSAPLAWRTVAPAAAAAGAATASDWAGSPLATAAFLTLTAALLPVASMASTRLMLAAIGGLAVATTIFFSGINLDARWVTPLVAATMVFCGWLAARHRPDRGWWPRMDVGDGLVLLGGSILMCLLLIPYWGLSPDGVLLDLGRGIDNLMHLGMFLDVAGGTESEASRGYPKGFHALIFLVGGGSLEGLSRPSLIPYFGMNSAIFTAASAMICGWTAVGVAGSMRSREASQRTSRSVAGLIFGLFASVGGLYGGMFEVGHVAFLGPVAVVIGSSWLALPARRFTLSSVAILSLATIGVLGTYPPLISGLVPAGVWLVRTAIGHHGRTRPRWLVFAVASILIGVASALFLNRWGGSFRGIGVHAGEVSTPMTSFLIYAAIALLLALIAVRAGHALPVSVWGPTVGFGTVGVVVAVLAAFEGTPVLESYYAEKLLQATWLAGSVMVIGLAAVLVVRWKPGTDPTRWPAISLRACVLLLLLGTILVVPEGRYWTVKGAVPSLELLQRRVSEAERARDDLHVLAIAEEVGNVPGEAIVLADPHGWLLPVAFDDVTRFLSTPTWAVNIARGPLTSQTSDLASCMEGPDGVNLIWACSRQLVQEHADARVTIVVEDPVLGEALRRAGTDRAIRVVLQADLLSNTTEGG